MVPFKTSKLNKYKCQSSFSLLKAYMALLGIIFFLKIFHTDFQGATTVALCNLFSFY